MEVSKTPRKNIFRLFTFLLISLMNFTAIFPNTLNFTSMETIKIGGVITGEDGAFIKDVKVTVDGLNVKESKSDSNGYFVIDAPKNARLSFFKRGYLSQVVETGDNLFLDISLKEDERDSSGEDVYVLFGTQKKNRMTGSYSQIYGDEIETRAVVNNKNKLTGLMSGLFIMQSNGEPGDESADIFMRGKRTMRSQQPIILIDGYERSMNLIDPNEIEAITVLKDAATASRFGIRSGNGIIQITTKRGTEGKVRVRSHIRGGLKMPTTTPELLDSYDYATLYNEARRNDGASPLYSDTHLEKYLNVRNNVFENDDDKYLYPNTNWYEDYTKKLTWQQRYSASVDGGNNFAKYFVSLGYTSNSGMYNVDKSANTYNTNANQQAITIRSNVDINVTERFLMSLDLSGRQEERNWPGARGNSSLNIFRSFYKTPPNAFPVFQKDLAPNGLPMLGGTKDYSDNIYGMLNRSGYSQSLIRNTNATLRLKHDLDFITKGLNVRGEVAFDSWYEMNTNRSKDFKVYGIDQDSEGQPILNDDGSFRYIETGNDSQMSSGGDYPGSQRILNYRFGFDYERTFGDHYLFMETLFNQREISQEDDRNLPRIYRGYDGRLSYNFKEKYLLDLNFGIMGSEQFLEDDRFGFFPAVSAGWLLTKENFLKNNPFINYLKLRGSYGLTGWDDVGGYFLWFQQFGSSGGTNFGYTSIGYSGWNEGAFALNNVTWEKIKKADVGIDASLFNDRLSFTFDYFQENNRDIMVSPSLPYIMGIRFPNFPIGRVKNKGFDFSGSYGDKIGDFAYELYGVFTKADNVILEMGEETKKYPYQQRTGKPIDSQWGLVALGLFQNETEIANSPRQTYTSSVRPGDIKYMDVNGDGVIDDFDEVYLGLNADPNLQWGSGLKLAWKNIDFNILFTGQNGGWINLTGESVWEFHDNGTVRKHHLDRFNPEDPSSWETATYPRLTLENKQGNQHTSTYWRKKTNQARLKHVELGYNIPVNWSKGAVNSLRIYVNAYNLLTWQSTDLVDVEATSGHYVQYPIQKMVNFGLSIAF